MWTFPLVLMPHDHWCALQVLIVPRTALCGWVSGPFMFGAAGFFGWHHLSNRSSSSDVQGNCNTANCESHVLTCANLGENQKLHIFSQKCRFGKIFWILTDFWNSIHSGGCPLFRLNRTWSLGAGSVDHLAGLHHGGHLGAGKALHWWVLRSHAIWWQSAHHVPWDQEEAVRHHPVPEFCSGDLLRWIPICGTSSSSRPYPH